MFCRVDETFDQFLSGTLTRDDWHLLNHKGCEALQSTGGTAAPNNTTNG